MNSGNLFDGIKVLAVARQIAAPFATYQLAMHGAEVLTIENATNQRPDPVFYAIANMTWVVDRRTGDVTYRLDGKDAFVDVGQKINLIDNRETTLAASLKVAQEKFGSYLHVTGSDQLKREITTVAAKHGLNVRFT